VLEHPRGGTDALIEKGKEDVTEPVKKINDENEMSSKIEDRVEKKLDKEVETEGVIDGELIKKEDLEPLLEPDKNMVSNDNIPILMHNGGNEKKSEKNDKKDIKEVPNSVRD
jgi:hypothetical protein